MDYYQPERGRTITSHASKIEELEISSYRAEAYGILDVIELIHHFQDQVEEWILFCDNEALINQLKLSQEIDEIPSKWNNCNIISIIKEKVIAGGSFHHVKGHQELTKENKNRIEVRLNILVDSMGNQAISSMLTTKGTPNNSHIQNGNKHIFKLNDIKDHCSRQQFHQYQDAK
jgi:hypothetical protein